MSTAVVEPSQPQDVPQANAATMNGEFARRLAMELIHNYFTTEKYPLTRHHIDSQDQFLQRDLVTTIQANNPILILKEPLGEDTYRQKTEIFVGGDDGNQVFVGTPTISLDRGNDVRLLFPNEARLRNLTYAVQIEADITVRVTLQLGLGAEPAVHLIRVPRVPICNMPLMLHSRYCMLHGKSSAVLEEMGECPQDQGGYFIVDGSEKVLITRQEGAFNTLYINPQPLDPKIEYQASISSLNPKTREVKRVAFQQTRQHKVGKGDRFVEKSAGLIEVSIPFVLKPIPLFILFRALGIQSDAEIIKTIFPDMESPEAKQLADLLIPCINQARPFVDTYSAINYIRLLTKGFSEFHVLDIVHNHLFPHVEDLPGSRAAFLAECVRKILRVAKNLDEPPSRDDTRNQRLLSSGFLTQMLFQGNQVTWLKRISRSIDEMYNYNKTTYRDENFLNIFSPGNHRTIFAVGALTEGIMRGFKGRWEVGSGNQKEGVLQALSRLSYLDFMSHCRRVVLDFDTSMKLQGPRRLNTSQYGYFCTSETPSGSHIGVTKNLTIMTAISTGSDTSPVIRWLFHRGQVVPCEGVSAAMVAVMVPVQLNAGIVGQTTQPKLLSRVLRLLKRTGCLPPLSSCGFNYTERKVFIYLDPGRPLRPLMICEPRGTVPNPNRFKGAWRDFVVGNLKGRESVDLSSIEFVDPISAESSPTLEDQITVLEPHQGTIEQLDPQEQNDALIANYPEHVIRETTHMEVHPSTILGLLGNMIPQPNHNQSPRNQLSASQSKQGLSMQATNWKNRYDNNSHILCQGEAPICRTVYQDQVGNGKMTQGQNIILAMGMYGGQNQEDGIIMNKTALQRGQFRSICQRSQEAFEEDDPMSKTQTRIGNPAQIPGWMELNSALDQSKLDDAGIVRVGEQVDQNVAIVGRQMMNERGQMKDASVTPQVWTRGRVESVVITVNNNGLRLVKIRVVQDRSPELGDKFSNRHGQKGTLNVAQPETDMPRTADGIVPDMIMNPTAIPSRMTIGQILEMTLGIISSELGAVGNCTAFMNDGSPHEEFGRTLESLGMNKHSNQVLQNGQTGEMITADIQMGVVYGMRLKHMTEDKWNARGEGRREQRTHQPTGGRGNEGGLKIGEMERDAICAHGITSFIQESMMKRSDGTSFIVCNGCGTIPIYNERQNLQLCPLCDGPIRQSGDSPANLEPIPPPVRSAVSFSRVEMPQATKLFLQELDTFLNMGLRILTTKDTMRLKGMDRVEELTEADMSGATQPLPVMKQAEISVPEIRENTALPTASEIVDEISKLNSEEALKPTAAEVLGAPRNMGVDEAMAAVRAITAAPAAPAEAPAAPAAPAAAPVAPTVPFIPAPTAPGAPAPGGVEIVAGPEGPSAPLIVVDTSDQAMAADGLATGAPAAAPAAPGEIPPTPAPRKRLVRRTEAAAPAPPQAPLQEGGVYAPGSPAAAGLLQNTGGYGNTTEPGEGEVHAGSMDQKPPSSGPIKVIKITNVAVPNKIEAEKPDGVEQS